MPSRRTRTRTTTAASPGQGVRRRRRIGAATLVVATTAATAAAAVVPVTAASAGLGEAAEVLGARGAVKVATFNAALNRNVAGELVADLSTPDDPQARNVAEIIQRVRPDVLLLNEFDHDADGDALRLFRENYLAVPHEGAAPIDYPYAYTAPSNTGVPSGYDLNNDGVVGGPDDAFGFGTFEGQYGMAVYSRYPIDLDAVRTFQTFRWKDLPGAHLPDDPATEEPLDWFTEEELGVVRLSSKSHWDVPIRVGNRRIHFLVSHPTPPVFDGPEDRNGLRNLDEIGFWSAYLDDEVSDAIHDDEGVHGGLAEGELFVVAGDLNSDPLDGDSVPGAAQQVLDHPRVQGDVSPRSRGGGQAARLQGGANDDHESRPRYDTADFADTSPGNLRADYVIPGVGLDVRRAKVFWPRTDHPLYRLTGSYDPTLPPPGFPSSDHRMVHLKIVLGR